VITVDDVRQARQRVAPVLRPTPVTSSESLSRLAGRPVHLKPEHLQRTGSYKIRGAFNLISRLDAATTPAGVVAASAGNHAQGVALAASLCGMRSTIFMPVTASLPKVEATRGYGAEIRFVGDTVDEALAAAVVHAEQAGATLVPPFDHPLVIAGQGTVGLELAEEAPDATALVVPIGGGGLIAGVGASLADVRPRPLLIGVEAAGAAAMRASLDAGRCVTLPAVRTMADGISLKSPSELTLDHVRAHVDDVVTVTEEQISEALLLLLERAKTVVEPSGAVGLAAVLAGKVPGTGPVATVLSGGNVDPLLLVKLIHHGLASAGRYLRLRIPLDDRPGSLARLTAAVAGLGLNVLSVEHHRSGPHLAVDEVEVLLTLETRNADHRHAVVKDLADAGFGVEPLD
jgi:threonine dehydratase